MFVLILSNKDIYEIKSSGICLNSLDYNVLSGYASMTNFLCTYKLYAESQNIHGYVFLIASLIMYLIVRVHFILRQYSDALVFSSHVTYHAVRRL